MTVFAWLRMVLVSANRRPQPIIIDAIVTAAYSLAVPVFTPDRCWRDVDNKCKRVVNYLIDIDRDSLVFDPPAASAVKFSTQTKSRS